MIIAEDSGRRCIFDIARKFDRADLPVTVILNDPQLGQIRSIDRLYSHIDTEWIFHCEDDWEFLSNGFISSSFAVMQEIDSCSMVSLRGFDYVNVPDAFVAVDAVESVTDIYVANLNSGWGDGFVGMHFNPGLRRMRDYRIVGPYSRLGLLACENLVSRLYESLGYRVCAFANRHVRHLGHGSHVRDPAHLHVRDKKHLHSVIKRIVPIYWRLNPLDDPFAIARRKFEKARPDFRNWRAWNDIQTH